MSQYPDGAYNYYATEKSTRPIICELMADYVSECGEQHWRPLSEYQGRFVRLQEVREIETHEPDARPAA